MYFPLEFFLAFGFGFSAFLYLGQILARVGVLVFVCSVSLFFNCDQSQMTTVSLAYT